MKRQNLKTLGAITLASALLFTGCSASSKEAAQSTEEPEVADTNEVVEKKSKEGTRANPYPLGTEVTEGDWTIKLNSVELDGTEAVAEANEFNDPAPDGEVYIIANLTATYNGTDPDGAEPMFLVEYVTEAGNTVHSYDTLAVAPDPFDLAETLYEGASTTGDVVLSVPADTAGEGVLVIDGVDLFSGKSYFAVK